MENTIREEWEEYYNYLEDLRKSGVTNMFGAAPYLVEDFCIDKYLAREILSNWMQNYSALSDRYGWGE